MAERPNQKAMYPTSRHPGAHRKSGVPCLLSTSNVPNITAVTQASVVFERLEQSYKASPSIVDEGVLVTCMSIISVVIGGLIGMFISPPACLISIGFASFFFRHQIRCTLLGVLLVYLGAWLMFEMHPAMYLAAAIPAFILFAMAWGLERG